MSRVTKGRWGKNGQNTFLHKAQGGRCCYCGVEFLSIVNHRKRKNNKHPLRATREHIQRTADGGKSTSGNIALSCRPCNVGRGDIPAPVWKTIRAGEQVPEFIMDFVPEHRRLELAQ